MSSIEKDDDDTPWVKVMNENALYHILGLSGRGKFSAREKNGEEGKKENSTLNEGARARTRKAELSTLNEIVSSYQALISVSPKAKVLVIFHMAERQAADQQQHQIDAQMQSPQPQKEDMVACVIALEAALLPCLPARELQAIDRSPHPSHQIDVERHARDFMEAAKKLQLYFIGLQREDQPTKAEQLRKVI
ncbi:unnamed protein product [Prunus armeniaca]